MKAMDVSMFGERERGEGKRERIREGGREGRAEWGREREKKSDCYQGPLESC